MKDIKIGKVGVLEDLEKEKIEYGKLISWEGVQLDLFRVFGRLQLSTARCVSFRGAEKESLALLPFWICNILNDIRC